MWCAECWLKQRLLRSYEKKWNREHEYEKYEMRYIKEKFFQTFCQPKFDKLKLFDKLKSKNLHNKSRQNIKTIFPIVSIKITFYVF